VIGSREAMSLGLVNAVLGDDSFDTDVNAWVDRLTRKPPGTRSLLCHRDGLSFEAAIESGVYANTLARTTEECKEGVRRFLEKRG